MKYIARATHLHHIIWNLKPDAVFKTDAKDIWLECDTGSYRTRKQALQALYDEVKSTHGLK